MGSSDEREDRGDRGRAAASGSRVAAQDSRERLVRAASALFAARGFEGASTREIAARAGLNQGLIRYHFGGKDALWREVVDRGLGLLADELAARSMAAPDEGRVAVLLAAFAQHPEPVRAIVHALLDPGPRREWLLRERLGPLQARAADWLMRDTPSPRTPVDPAFLLMWLAAAVAPSLFGSALASIDRRELDPTAVQREQRDALEPWLRGHSLLPHAGPWSLAAARRRRAARTRG